MKRNNKCECVRAKVDKEYIEGTHGKKICGFSDCGCTKHKPNKRTGE